MTEKAKRVTWIERLEALNPCSEALNYARAKRSLAEAWRDCGRADWMLWLLGWTEAGPPESPRRRTLAGCVADVVAPALRHVHEKDRRPALAIREVRRWARNDPRATLETLAAAGAAMAAADNAAKAVVWAAEADAWAAAKAATLKYMTAIVRRHYPKPPRLPR